MGLTRGWKEMVIFHPTASIYRMLTYVGNRMFTGNNRGVFLQFINEKQPSELSEAASSYDSSAIVTAQTLLSFSTGVTSNTNLIQDASSGSLPITPTDEALPRIILHPTAHLPGQQLMPPVQSLPPPMGTKNFQGKQKASTQSGQVSIHKRARGTSIVGSKETAPDDAEFEIERITEHVCFLIL